jgi:hypothetical protein
MAIAIGLPVCTYDGSAGGVTGDTLVASHAPDAGSDAHVPAAATVTVAVAETSVDTTSAVMVALPEDDGAVNRPAEETAPRLAVHTMVGWGLMAFPF